MNTKHISLAFAVAFALLAGCAKNSIEQEVKPSEQLTDLELSYVGATETKAAIDGTTFPQEGEIGLFLFKDEMAETPYGESGYANVKYSYNSTKEKWTASPSIKVGSETGYLYGYYPYKSASTDVKAIPVASSLNGDDVMYTTKQTVTDATAAQTAITMNHALARVSITVKNNGYTGDAKLSKIKFSGAEIALAGTLNATSGSISATKSDVTLDVPTANQTITATGTTHECLLVPSDGVSGKQTINLTLTIDGEEKTANLTGDNGVIIAQGTKSNITITLSNSGISVQTVSVEDWNVIEVGGKKVTIKVHDTDAPSNDILFWAYLDGDAAKIDAFSKSGQSLGYVISGDATCDKTKSNNIYTFTISDITSDVTATIGYQRVESITLNLTSDSPAKGWYSTLSATILPEDANIKDVDWSSNHPDIAAVDAKGLVTAIVQGKAIITASATDDSGVAATCTVTVGDPIADSLPYDFSVSATKRIHFSRGNLYYDGTNWGFEQEQHYFRTYCDGTNNGGKCDANGYSTTSGTINGHWGLFGWSTSIPTNNYGMSSSTTVSDYSGDFYDWGNAIDGCAWRTLTGGTDGEWKYLFEHYFHVQGTCNGVPGLFITPDSFDGNSDKLEDAITDWETAQAAGIVFLPAAGSRCGNAIESVGEYGHYWASNAYDEEDAHCIHITNPVDYVSRYIGYSVRLVTEVK